MPGPRPIAAGLAAINPDDEAGLRTRSAKLREMVVDGALPSGVRETIDAAFAELIADDGSARVAVRSSATAEDAAEYSFAGMFESVLNVRTRDELYEDA